MCTTKKDDIPSVNACDYYDSGTCRFAEYCAYQEHICCGDIEPCVERFEAPLKN